MSKTKMMHCAAVAVLAMLPWSAALAEDPSLTVVSWGGSYARACVKGYHERFTAETGIAINLEDYNGGLAQIRAQVDVGNVYWDVVDLEIPDLVRGCDEGLLEYVEIDSLPAGPDGTPPAEDFVEGTLTDCGPATIFYSTVYAYNDENIEGEKPATMADFFDLEKFPGRRGMRRSPLVNLEFALIADGVSLDSVYAILDTPEGVDRAFRKLDTIKDQIIWWEAGGPAAADAGRRRGGDDHGLQRPHLQRPGPGGPALRHRLGRPGPGHGGSRHRRRHPPPRGGAPVRPLRLHRPGHRRRGPLHRLQSHAQIGHAPDLNPRREGRGDEPPHAHERAERQPRPAQQLGVVERPRRRDERALQHLAGEVSGQSRDPQRSGTGAPLGHRALDLEPMGPTGAHPWFVHVW